MKTIKINGYPAYFQFKIRTKLPKFIGLDNCTHQKPFHCYCEEKGRTDKCTENSRNGECLHLSSSDCACGYCAVRQKLILKYLKKLDINSPCHCYEDYIVERVEETEDGELWTLGS